MKEEKNMKVFISWSGELSMKVAEELKETIPCILQFTNVFFSPEDIKKGKRWEDAILEELEETNYGIVCLSKENMNASWINFEAGALSKIVSQSNVSTVLIDLEAKEIEGPLSAFQATRLTDKEDFWMLIRGINNSSETQVADSVVRRAYDSMWEEFYSKICDAIKTNTLKNIEKEKKEQNLELLLPMQCIEKIYSDFIKKSEINNFLIDFLDRIVEYVEQTDEYEVGKLIVDCIFVFVEKNDLGRDMREKVQYFIDKLDNKRQTGHFNLQELLDDTDEITSLSVKNSEVKDLSKYLD